MSTNDFCFVDIPEEIMPEAKDLPGDLCDVAEIVGVRKTLQLAQRFRGTHVYFRSIDSLIRKKRNISIREEYDQGVSVSRLARKYKLTSRQIWTILGQV